MSTILRAGIGSKGGRDFGDASYRTAYLRKQAIIAGQVSKTGNPATTMTTAAQAMKPLLTEHHLTQGFTKGIQEFIVLKNPTGFF
jgi:hypothetical protein